MIKALYTAGKILSQLADYGDYFRPWSNPFPKVRGEAKVIIAEVIDGVLNSDLQLEDFKTAMVDKYLFREAKANATNLVPTFYVQPQSDAEKQAESIRKVIKKIRQSVSNCRFGKIGGPGFWDGTENINSYATLHNYLRYLRAY
jgi:hypothetical protein